MSGSMTLAELIVAWADAKVALHDGVSVENARRFGELGSELAARMEILEDHLINNKESRAWAVSAWRGR